MIRHTTTTTTMAEKFPVDELFHKSWFRPIGLSTLLLLLWSPIGLLLLFIRCFIAIQFFLLSLVLPSSKIRQKCLRIMSGVLGISISTDGGDPGGKLIVSNHVTLIDHMAIHLATNAELPTKIEMSSLVAKLFAFFRQSEDTLTREEILTCEHPLTIFPEDETTSGEVGLLAFTSQQVESIPEGLSIQPVAIKVNRFLLNSNCVTTSLLKDILITLFLPITHFSLRFMPTLDSDLEGLWKARAQELIASNLGIKATKYNKADKSEWMKRYLFQPPSMTTMARSVQQQLSPRIVSAEAVLSALERIGSVEGAVEYLRQDIGPAPAPSSFSKSATQRMTSFQERKRIMIAIARKSYIEKYGLKI